MDLPVAFPPSSWYNWRWLFWKRLFCLLATLFSTYQRIFVLPAWILFFRNELTATAPLSNSWYRRSNSCCTLSRTLVPLLISTTLDKSFRHRSMFPSILLCHRGFSFTTFLPFPNFIPNLLATTTPAAYNSLLTSVTSMFGFSKLCISPSTNSTSTRTLFLSAARKFGTSSQASPSFTSLRCTKTFLSTSFNALADPSFSTQVSSIASITTIGSASILPSSTTSTTKSTSCLSSSCPPTSSPPSPIRPPSTSRTSIPSTNPSSGSSSSKPKNSSSLPETSNISIPNAVTLSASAISNFTLFSISSLSITDNDPLPIPLSWDHTLLLVRVVLTPLRL